MEARWQRMRGLFESACTLEPDIRRRWLKRACGNDGALLRDVESLLAAHDTAPAHFESPVFQLTDAAPQPADDPHRHVGRRLGPYEITRFIASGGMGHVFAARRADDQFEKTVAIKLIRPDLMNDGMARRFQRERQALAMFDHPNVARLIDASVSVDGCPYIVMEYVEGCPITEYCRDRGFDISERLRLFLQVCDAVQRAHEHLIVHCDLKPGNILVSADGECKLLDFSIAKLLDPPRPLGAGATTSARHMTPEYASPEQIRGEPVSTRTDIYMLGLVLYELLTDVHPFRTGHRPLYELQRIVCEDDPARPSTAVARAADAVELSRRHETTIRRRRLTGDLDAIVLTAMRRAPDDRYRSVERLADDVRRHLRGLPIHARPHTTFYRVNRFVRRNRGVVLAGAAAVMTLLGGTIGMGWLYRVAATQRAGAVEARARAERNATSAAAEARRAGTVVEFLQSMMAAADPVNAGGDVKVLDVLEAAAARIPVEFADDPALESATHAAIGKTFAGLGRYADAEPHLLRSLEIETNLAQAQLEDDEDAYQRSHERVARAHRDLGELYYRTGELDKAMAHAQTALETSRRYLGAESEAVALDLNNLAAIHRARGDLDRAEALLTESVAIREKSSGADSLEVAESLNNLANVIRGRGDLAGAEAHCRRVLRIRRQHLPENHPTIAQSLDNLGVVLCEQGRFDEARPMMRQSVSIYRAIHPDGHPDLATGLFNLGSTLCVTDHEPEAVPLLNEALEIRLRFFDASSAVVVGTRIILGESLLRLERLEDAESMLLAAEDAATRAAPRDPVMLARIRDDLSTLYAARDDPINAAEWRRLKSMAATTPDEEGDAETGD